MSKPMSTEPAVTVGTITAIVAALVTAAVAFGLPLTDDQQKALLGLAAVLAPIAVGVLVRPKVTPVDKHEGPLDPLPETAYGDDARPIPPSDQ